MSESVQIHPLLINTSTNSLSSSTTSSSAASSSSNNHNLTPNPTPSSHQTISNHQTHSHHSLKSTTSISTQSQPSTTHLNQNHTRYFTTYPTRRPPPFITSSPASSSSIAHFNPSRSDASTPTPSRTAPSPSGSLATDALLFQSLRADAQDLGLESDSLGWAILRFLSSPDHSHRPIRSLMRRLNSSTQLLLILPKSVNHLPSITPDLIYDHLLLITTPDEPGSASCFSSLSGWKGLIEGDRLLVCSPGRSLDQLCSSDLDPSSLVPTIKPSTSLSSELTAPARLRLPLYSFSSPSAQTFILPGLPPSRPPTTSSSTTQRLASLFGPRISPASTLDPELAEPADEPISLSVRILSSGPLASPTLDLAVRDALRNRIQDALGNLEQSVLAHITAFVDRLSLAPPDLPHALGSQLSSLYLSPKDEVGDAMQDLYRTLETELEEEFDAEGDSTAVIVNHTLELVEEVICVELYDRLLEDADLEADEELSSKIAGLNLIDVTLDHLGLDLERREMDDPDTISTIRSGFEQIITLATAELSRLQDAACRSPREKLGVFVRVHKLIVDGLSALPPIPMKRDGPAPFAILSDPAGASVTPDAVEMTATASSSSDPHPRVPSASLPTPTPLRPHDPTQASTADLLDALTTELTPPLPQPEPVVETIPSPEPALPRPPSSSSADLILPMLIFLLIKTNPPRLCAHLGFVRRHRVQRLLTGEADYCLVNFHVACAFLRDVELEGEVLCLGTRAEAVQKPEPPKEREEALVAARRMVSTMLVGGYQRVVSGATLLDSSAPRTLEEVKRMVGGSSEWGSRVGLLKRGAGAGGGEETRSTSRLGGLFKSTSSSTSLSNVAVPDEERPTLGSRLSSLPGLARRRRSTHQSSGSRDIDRNDYDLSGGVRGVVGLEVEGQEGPIERFERCRGAEELVMGDITLLVKDYQRLARLGRRAGIWK